MEKQPPLSEYAHRYLPYLVAISFFMQMLDVTILNTALPSIAKSFGCDALNMHSVVISYMLTVAIMIPTSGWLSDKLGSRRAFILAFIVFCAGSLLCALSTSVIMLSVSRIVQGVGAAFLMPVGRLVLLRTYPRDQFVRVMNMVSVPGLLGPLLGPMLGGFLSQHASWHWIFLINIPFGIIGIIAAIKFMPNLFAEEHNSFDFRGFFLFVAGVVCLSLSLEAQNSAYQNGEPMLFGLLAAGIFFLGCYWIHARFVQNAIFKLRLFKTQNFRIGILGNLISRLGGGAMPYLMPLFFQLVLGYSAFKSGLSLLPLALGSIVIKFAVPPLLERFGYKFVMTGNTILIGLFISSFSLISPNTSQITLLCLLTALGMVNSIQFTCMNTVTLIDLPKEDASGGNALLSVVMQLSVSLGIGMAAALIDLFRPPATVDLQHGLQATFHKTFLIVGCFSILSSLVFMRIHKQKGRKLKPLPKEHHIPIDHV